MEIDMENQFQKLKDIIGKVDKFYFGVNKGEYLGPIDPTSIVTLTSSTGLIAINFLILAERVPAFYLPFEFDSNHLEVVTVYLDQKYEFRDYNPEAKELNQLSILVGDRAYSYDGTVSGASEFFENNNWTFRTLY